jgi:glucosamine kinase
VSTMTSNDDRAAAAGPMGLGIDAGGTQTRWALASPSGEVLANGHVEGLSALQMGSDAGRERLAKTLAEMATAVLAVGRPTHVVAGMTGFAEGEQKADLARMIAAPLGIDDSAVSLSGDMEIAYLDVFAPGEGYLVYAGTGSIAAYMDEAGQFFRVGGHGGILDDGGSGFWIAIQALRHVWRAEDENPGSGASSPMGREIFLRIGGNDWLDCRQFVYGGGFETNRGKIGRLALAVAAAADADPNAHRILSSAGEELARLGKIMTSRFGPRPIALAGRVVTLHPAIEKAMRAALPDTAKLTVSASDAHHAAARIAARARPA